MKRCLECKHQHETDTPIPGKEYWCRCPVPPWGLDSMERMRGLGYLLKSDLAEACVMFVAANDCECKTCIYDQEQCDVGTPIWREIADTGKKRQIGCSNWSAI